MSLSDASQPGSPSSLQSQTSLAESLSSEMGPEEDYYDDNDFQDYLRVDDDDRNAERLSKAMSTITTEASVPWGSKFVLSFDGGGHRAYSSLLILKALMTMIETMEHEYRPRATRSASSPLFEPSNISNALPSDATSNSAEDFLPYHYFDYIGGTSTGGLIAIMLGRLRMNVDAVLEKYVSFSQIVFGSPRRGSIPHFAHVFKTQTKGEMFATHLNSLMPSHSSPEENPTMFESDEARCHTIVCAMERKSTKDRGLRPYLFRSYKHESKNPSRFMRNPGAATPYKISEVAHAAVAAPQLHHSMTISDHRYYEPGPGLNNPSSEIYQEVASKHDNLSEPIGMFLSIGCGARRTGESDRMIGSGGWKFKKSFKKRETELSEGADKVHGSMLKMSKAENFQYLRFDVKEYIQDDLLEDWQKIVPGRSALDRIKKSTNEYLKSTEVKAMLRECASELVRRRRQRADTLQWESFALGIRYCCRHQSLCRAQEGRKRFSDRNALLDHLRRVHKEPPPDVKNFEHIKSLLDSGRTNSDKSEKSKSDSGRTLL